MVPMKNTMRNNTKNKNKANEPTSTASRMIYCVFGLASMTTLVATAVEGLKSNTDFGAFDRLRRDESLSVIPVFGNDGASLSSSSSSSYVGRNLHRLFLNGNGNNNNDVDVNVNVNVNDVESSKGNDNLSLFEEQDSPDDGLLFCHVPTMLRFSTWNPDMTVETTTPMTRKVAYSGSVGALLAMHHFNTGNGSVVYELQGINRKCPIRLTTEVLDTRGSPFVAVQSLTKLLTRASSDAATPQPCALFGSQSSVVSERLASLAGPFGLPQISSSAMSTSLNDNNQYPTFARTHTDVGGFGEMAVSYLKDNLGVTNAGLYFPNDGYGLSFQKSVLDAAEKLGVDLVSVPYRPMGTDGELEESLMALKDTGLNYFLGAFSAGTFGTIMNKAGELGVAGPGKFWLASGSAGTAPSLLSGQFRVPKGSGLERAVKGNGLIFCKGGLPGIDSYDRFTKAWKSIPADDDLLDYLHSKLPAPVNPDTPAYTMPKGFYEEGFPHHDVTFSYDAIVALGLSACELLEQEQAQQQQQQQDGDGSRRRKLSTEDVSNALGGTHHRDNLIHRSFSGASGDVVFANDKSTRTADSSYFVMANLVASDFNDTHTTFKGSPVPFFYDTKVAKWLSFGPKPFVYADNTTDAPSELPPQVEEMNQITATVRGVGLFLGAFAMAASLICLLAMLANLDNGVMKASQPIFLVLICGGTFLLAAAIVPLSIDDGIASPSGCDVACASAPWLFFLGFVVTFSALFAKTWRINQVVNNATNFRRVEINPRDVMMPLVVLLVGNLCVLAAWTITNPIRYERETLEVDRYGRPSESIGSCVSDRWIPFVIALVVINLSALVFALAQAYRGRKLDSIFNESEYIGIAILSIFQSFLIGVPLMIIVREYPTAYYFVQVSICFVVSAATTLLIFVPKFLFMLRGGFEENPERKSVVSTKKVSDQSGGFKKYSNSSGGFRFDSGASISARFKSEDTSGGLSIPTPSGPEQSALSQVETTSIAPVSIAEEPANNEESA